jgi:hypothetical protein
MIDNAENAKLIDKLLRDPLLLRKLSDKVYQLMVEDLRQQRDRSGNYKR